MKLPQERISQMIGNVIIDFFLDFIPIFGQIVDFAFKSNILNIEIIEKYAPEIFEGQVV